MAAGLGFKTFTTGEVLTASDVNGYLMQGVLVFADAAARSAAITSPQEGQYSYLKDSNSLWYYSGSAWLSAGGSPLTTKGDLYGFSTTDARIPVGANDTVLTADSTAALGVKWASASSSVSFTLLNSGNTTVGTSTSKTWSSLPAKNTLFIAMEDVSCTATNAFIEFDFTTTQAGDFSRTQFSVNATGVTSLSSTWQFNSTIRPCRLGLASGTAVGYIRMEGANSTTAKPFVYQGSATGDSNNAQWNWGGGVWDNTAVITSVTISNTTGNFDGGNVYIYGA